MSEPQNFGELIEEWHDDLCNPALVDSLEKDICELLQRKIDELLDISIKEHSPEQIIAYEYCVKTLKDLGKDIL